MCKNRGIPEVLRKQHETEGAKLHVVHQGFVAFSHPAGHFLIYPQYAYDRVVPVDAATFHGQRWQLKALFNHGTPVPVAS
jgi:hypothetical protein